MFFAVHKNIEKGIIILTEIEEVRFDSRTGLIANYIEANLQSCSFTSFGYWTFSASSLLQKTMPKKNCLIKIETGDRLIYSEIVSICGSARNKMILAFLNQNSYFFGRNGFLFGKKTTIINTREVKRQEETTTALILEGDTTAQGLSGSWDIVSLEKFPTIPKSFFQAIAPGTFSAT